jgi:hypothetical protein
MRFVDGMYACRCPVRNGDYQRDYGHTQGLRHSSNRGPRIFHLRYLPFIKLNPRSGVHVAARLGDQQANRSRGEVGFTTREEALGLARPCWNSAGEWAANGEEYGTIRASAASCVDDALRYSSHLRTISWGSERGEEAQVDQVGLEAETATRDRSEGRSLVHRLRGSSQERK